MLSEDVRCAVAPLVSVTVAVKVSVTLWPAASDCVAAREWSSV